MAPNLLGGKSPSDTGRTSALKNDIDFNLKLLNDTFPRLELHACLLTRTISLSYHSIHIVSMLFRLVTHYFT